MAGICHGSVGLLNIKLSDGKFLVKGKKVTGFTNEEEKEIKLEKVVPMLLQTELEKRGAQFVVAKNWTSNLQSDQRLITGQNAQSIQIIGVGCLDGLRQAYGRGIRLCNALVVRRRGSRSPKSIRFIA